MVKLAIICEGKTERLFAEQLLASHFSSFGIEIGAIEIGVDCKQPGGNVSFDRVCHDLAILLSDYDRVTTLIDFFRLGSGWSGKALLKPGMTSAEQGKTVENAALEDAQKCLPEFDIANRFIPNVLMHEFEGLLFADPEAIVEVTRAHASFALLRQVSASFHSPEDINTGSEKAPSKRLANLGANYGKIAHGVRIVARIGLATIRAKCPHFNEWLAKVESISGASPELKEGKT